MISFKDQVFRLDTKNTTYAFRINDGYLEHLYYGRRVPETDFQAMALKNTIDLGATVKQEGSSFFLERNLLEYSGIGRGDYRHSPIELLMPDGTFVCDFVYDSHRSYDSAYTTNELPTAYGEAKTLEITLKDKKFGTGERYIYLCNTTTATIPPQRVDVYSWLKYPQLERKC